MELSSLRKELSLVNETIYFDVNQFLREKTSQPKKLEQVIIHAEKLIEKMESERKNSIDKLIFLYGTIGNLYRVFDDLKKSSDYLEKALHYAIENQEKMRSCRINSIG